MKLKVGKFTISWRGEYMILSGKVYPEGKVPRDRVTVDFGKAFLLFLFRGNKCKSMDQKVRFDHIDGHSSVIRILSSRG